MRDVAVDVVSVIVHVAQLMGDGSHFIPETAVNSLCTGHVVAGGADSADAGDNAGQFLDGPAHDETLKTAQLGDLEEAVFHRAVIVQEDLDFAMPLEAGDWIDRNRTGHERWLLCSVEVGMPNRYA